MDNNGHFSQELATLSYFVFQLLHCLNMHFAIVSYPHKSFVFEFLVFCVVKIILIISLKKYCRGYVFSQQL